MSALKIVALAGGLVVGATAAATGADLPPPPMPYPAAPLRGSIDASGIYLRGDIGFSNQRVKTLDNVLFAVAPVEVLDKGFDGAPFFGVGVGYKFNNWFRADLTTEYRARANFHGLDRYVDPALPGGFGVNKYSASKSEWLTLANAYVDLGSWHGITPFLGAGIGASYNTISSFQDVNIATNGLAFGAAASKWNLAWALHAGLAYEVTPNFTVELAYRYLNLGHGRTGDLVTYTGVNAIDNPMHFKSLTSHDFKLGVRWLLAGPDYAPAPPTYVMRKG